MPERGIRSSGLRGDAGARPLERLDQDSPKNAEELQDDAARRVVLFASSLLRGAGVRHGFSTRRGGTSPPPFDTMNLAAAAAPPGFGQDLPGRIEENRRRFLTACGLEGLPWTRVRQVHGAAVASADVETDLSIGEADAIVADRPDRAIAVATADCVPILLACPRSGRVAAIHAGWRGLVAGVIERTLLDLSARGSAPGELLAAIGPSIGVDAYRVGADVVEAFRGADLASCIRQRGAETHANCHEAARLLLVRAGMTAANIDGTPLCTFANRGDFFSHRRDGPGVGRMAAVIAARAE